MKNITELSDLELDQKVHIQSTDFDRKRRLSDKEIRQMRLLFEEGYSLVSLADMFGVTPPTVKYNVDDDYRARYNFLRSGKHTGIQVMDFDNRVAYKRDLVISKKLKVYGV